MRFKGGVSVDSKGYLTIKAGPLRDVRVHTLVAEALLQRKLEPDEDVDHRDGNKLNCRWDNLIVRNKVTHGFVSRKARGYVENVILAERARQEEYAWDAYLKEKDEIDDTDFGFGCNAAVEGDSAEPSLGIRGTRTGSKNGRSKRSVQRGRHRNAPIPIDQTKDKTSGARTSASVGGRAAQAAKIVSTR